MRIPHAGLLPLWVLLGCAGSGAAPPPAGSVTEPAARTGRTDPAGPREPVPAPAREPEPASLPAPSAKGRDRRVLIRERMRDVPDWACREEGNFLILHSTAVETGILREIATRLRAMERLLRAEFPADDTDGDGFVVRLCKDRAQYHQYGGPGDSSGYWNPGEREMVSFVDGSGGRESAARIPGILVHAYFSRALEGVPPHDWFSVGLATCLSRCRLDGRGNLHPRRPFDYESAIEVARASGTLVPLPWFLRYEHAAFYGPDIHRNFGQAASFVWFLREQGTPAWRGILSDYYGALRAGVRECRSARGPAGKGDPLSPAEGARIREAAWSSAFGDFDEERWRRLEAAWIAFE